MKSELIKVGVAYSNGHGAIRLVTDEGPKYASSVSQQDTNCVQFRLVVRGRSIDREGSIGQCTRTAFASWARMPVAEHSTDQDALAAVLASLGSVSRARNLLSHERLNALTRLVGAASIHALPGVSAHEMSEARAALACLQGLPDLKGALQRLSEHCHNTKAYFPDQDVPDEVAVAAEVERALSAADDHPCADRAPTGFDTAYYALRDALDDEDTGNDEVRDAGLELCEALSQHVGPRPMKTKRHATAG